MRMVLSMTMALFLMLSVAGLPAEADEATKNKWNSLAWTEMKSDEKENWRVLGWNEEAWDSGKPSLAPASEEKSWSELTEKERNSAQQLGYDKKCWND